MKPIGENTPITVGIVIAIIGGVFWLTEIYTRGLATAQAVSDFQVDFRDMSRDIQQIKTDVAVIKQSVKEN